MNKRSLCILLCIAFALGLFFQYSRLDGFLHLGAVENRTLIERLLRPAPTEEQLPREKFLIVYDPTDVLSMYARHNMERILTEKRKAFESHPLTGSFAVDSSYRGVALATGHLGSMPMLPAVLDYARAGGTVLLLQKVEQIEGSPISAGTLADFGIAGLGGLTDVHGIHIRTNFLAGGKDFRFGENSAFTTHANAVALTEDATVHITSVEGMPLLWEKTIGEGRIYAYNGVERDDKTNLGVYAALMAHCGTETIYPVVGVKLFILDDFPAPVPEGDFERIYDELGVDTETFYRKIWWPFIRRLAEEEDIRYTGAIIETYGAQVKGPFRPLGGRAARDGLIIYGRELLNMGGELGLHGYNHQPLAPEGYGQPRLNYVPWESPEDMEEAMRELRSYVKSVYPDYEFRFYVPPSNIMSPEGKAAIRKVFPEVIAFGSLFDGPANERAYYQDFEYKDGVYELPRISSGHEDDGLMLWQEISALNYIGVFSHFIHPDELFYESSANTTWHEMETGMKSFMHKISTRFPWLKAETVSDSLPFFSDYFDMEYRVRRTKECMELYTWNYSGETRFLLRTAREIERTDGCMIERADEDVYLVRMSEPEARIYWKEAK
ncbi:DUF2194 domain-containing protein [Selenomonas sp. TAMA-11512]|uniref:DUF2194 domain-containing protein n=1 Tax=Selenomonas sp. TAMA-11512 TaxID=3095337 RepID=UPI00308A5A50|nr:DUF2194 domain-containing protein [Selenomonas sp. TAMA-11512]